MIKINKNTKIYVLCPANTKTGGPELLHQLVYKFNTFGYDATIAYLDTGSEDPTPADFKKYVNSFVTISDIEDNENNLLIVPETYIERINNFKNIRKALWWLSVDNYLKNYYFTWSVKYFGVLKTIYRCFNLKFFKKDYIKKYDYHLCQSYYAIDFLKKKNVDNVYYLSDYISEEFFKKDSKKAKKKSRVLYNPKKGYKFTQKLINRSKDIDWVAIKGLTTAQVKQLLSESKVYIDFGNHPGKDRFPREACMSGCCVITGKNGSAAYKEDVYISDEFKFANDIKNIDAIIKKIRYCLNNYDKEQKEFDEYRKRIINEENLFEEDIKKVFVKE